MLTIVDAWIKAAVEHKTLEITYYNKSKDETTVREVEPDYYGWSTNGRNFGCYGLCRLRGEDIRCFQPENLVNWRFVGDSFSPNPKGRWQELLPVYQQKGLANISFE
jgi:predicted DNA-binding transcriptional regulator YafY